MPDITLPVDKTTILPNGDDIARLDVNDMPVSLLHRAPISISLPFFNFYTSYRYEKREHLR